MITFEEAIELYENFSAMDLLYKALKYKKGFETCGIINAKSGKCKENCIFCSQSIYHKTNIKVYPLMSKEELKERILKLSEFVDRVGIVVSGRAIKEDEFNKIIEVIEELKDLNICCSLGLIDEDMLKELKKYGVRIHCNLETNREFFKNICSTHTYDDKVRVIKKAKSLGLEVCSGGIFGLGENYIDRIKLAFELRDLKVDSVPINIIHPIEGTKIYDLINRGEIKRLGIEEILKGIAIYKLILPSAKIRLAGGRLYLKEFQTLALMALDGLMIGNYLTTKGRDIEEDLRMIKTFLKLI
ncbi:biotin synthase BioB [Methanocaldococcus sp.]